MKYKHISLISPLALAISMVSPMVVADNGFEIEEVIITAQKREQSLQDVPLSVQALGADQLKQNSVNTISDISNLTPGLSIGGSQQTGGAAEISVRGVSTLTISAGLDASTPTYLDGVFLASPLILRELSDIARIEVLRGPQGTLFGRNAAAGAISVTTTAPTDEFEGSLELGYGSDDLFTARGVVNIPLTDSLRLRTSFAGRNRDGSISSSNGTDGVNSGNGGSDFLTQDHVAFRSRLAWDVSDSVSADFSGDFYKQNDLTITNTTTRFLDNGGGFLPFVPGVNIAPITSLGDKTLPSRTLADGSFDDPDFNVESWGLSARFNIELSDNLSLLSLTSYRKDEFFEAISIGDSISLDVGITTPFLTGAIGDISNDTKAFNQEFRLSGASDAVDWFVGLNYYYSEVVESEFRPLSPVGFGTAGTTYTAEIETNSGALFGDAIFHLTDTVNLTVGLRYSYDEKEIELPDNNIPIAALDPGRAASSGAAVAGGLLTQTGERANAKADWDDLSGRIVLDVSLTDDVLVYASVSQGYKSGGFNSVISDGQFLDDPFDKEKGLNYEVGTKSTFLDGRLRINGAFFYTDYEDFQTQVADPTPGSVQAINLTADADILGAELEATYYFNENFSLTWVSGWLNSQYSDEVLVTGGGVTAVAVEENQDLVRAPRFTHTLSANYLVPLGDAGELRLTASYNYTESQRLLNSPVSQLNDSLNGGTRGAIGLPPVEFFRDGDVRAEHRSLVNARATYTPTNEQWAVSIWGTNLTDEEFAETTRIAPDNALLSFVGAASTSYVRNEPRAVGIEFTYNFGG